MPTPSRTGAPGAPGPEGEISLATNAPEGWPIILASGNPAGDENATAYVRRLTTRVAAGLKDAGLDVVGRGRAVEVGQQVVSVDVIVRVGGTEVPVFVFPGLDPEREGAMFTFLRGAIGESGAFEASPLYYSARPLRYTSEPTERTVGRLADAFMRRAREGGTSLSYGSTAEEVVETVRAFAAAPMESSGTDTVMEAASFVGEWLRRRTSGEWVLREDLPRSVLVVRDLIETTQLHIPIFAWFPDAVRMGYDGLLGVLENAVEESERADDTAEPDGLPIVVRGYEEAAAVWLQERLPLMMGDSELVALFRRCSACDEMSVAEIQFEEPAGSVEQAIARGLLAPGLPAIPCDECGGVDYREKVLVYVVPVMDERGVVITEYADSHVRIATRLLEEEDAGRWSFSYS